VEIRTPKLRDLFPSKFMAPITNAIITNEHPACETKISRAKGGVSDGKVSASKTNHNL